MGKKRTARQRAIQKLDRVFSRFIRWKHVDHTGRVECYTCGSSDDPKNMHCGHFQSRRYMSTRWDEDNCRPQCVACNIYHQGRQYEFGQRLDTESDGLASDVIARSRRTTKYSVDDINDLIRHYDHKVQLLEE